MQQLRNLERDGVLPPAPRTPAGYRVYGDEHVLFALTYRGLAAGAGHAAARAILRAVQHGDRAQVFALLDAAHARVDRERRDLAAARTAAREIADETVNDPRPADDMSISELARALGIRPSTLRHWDAVGLLVPHRSRARGPRRYAPDEVRAARLVHQLRLAGYGIDALRRLVPELRGRRGWNDLATALTGRDARIDARSAALVEGAAALAALLSSNRGG